MVLRPLGRTGLRVSPVGFGAFKIGRNESIKYAQPYALPDQDEVERLLNGVLDLGINYIDTAPAYGLSEERIGRAIGHRRGEFVLSTKVGETFESGVSRYDFSAATVQTSVERSLQRLRTDSLDIVFVHAPREDLPLLEAGEVVPALQTLRHRGLVRFIGFSGKTTAAAQHALGWADVLMVEYHLDDTSHDAVMHAAAMAGVGVVVKKGLSSGRLMPSQAIPFVLRHPAVASLVIGGLRIEHFRDNIRQIGAIVA